jgi:hypothetical protein
MANPLVRSIPRPPATAPYGVVFGNDSTRQLMPANVPMQPTTGPDTGIVPPTQPSAGFTSRPDPSAIGAVGGMPSEPTTGKVFGSPMDARQYPARPFSPVMDGPGTAPSNQRPFNPPSLGNTSTQTPGHGNLSPSGTGIKDQPAPRIGANSTLPSYVPQESFHPRIGTVPSVSGRKRYFR